MNKSIIATQGVEATALDATIKAAELNWEPLTDAAGGPATGILLPGKKLLYRSDNRKALGIVGDGYSPSDPKEFVRTQFELAESVKGKVARVGFIEDRAQAFAFVRFGAEINIPREKRKVGDPVQAYIYTTDGWDGGTPRTSRLYIERLRCANGATSREMSANLWVSHTSRMKDRLEIEWKSFQKEATVQIAQIREEFTTLAQTRMSAEQCKAFLEKLLPGEGTRVENRRTEILNLFGEGGTGNEGVSRWDAYNAVTEFVTHRRVHRQTDNTSVETNRFIGVLEKNRISVRALDLLLERN